jgi:hypothetical protein
MIEQIHERIGVVAVYDPRQRTFYPARITWQLRAYTVRKVCYHHKVRQGRIILHIFHVTDGSMDFKLSFNTDTLVWVLEEICDGSPS